MRLLPAAILLCIALAGCSSTPLRPAPVVPTSATPVGPASAASSAPAAAAAPPGYYRVQRGDTLRSIARGIGRSWQDLVAWNQLTDPNRIEVGQVLRVVPPGTPGVPVMPATAPAPGGSAASPVAQSFALGPRAGTPAAPAAPPASTARHAQAASAAHAAPTPHPHAASAPAPRHEQEPHREQQPVHAGPLHWQWPAQGKVIRGFNGTSSKGLDIAGQAGQAVRAAAAGKVVYAGNELRGFGNLVIIKHNSEYISVYAHNQKLLVKDGQAVRRGETIALMGSTDAPRVELHFEVRLRGKPIDPEQVLPRR